MYRITRASAVAVLCLSVSTLVLAQRTKFDWDRTENFAAFHTYQWAPSPAPAKGAWDARITGQIDKQLHAKGLRKVDSHPDLYVAYSANVKKDKSVMSGGGYIFGPSFAQGDASPGLPATSTWFTEGTLDVELADAKTKQVVWRGLASDTLSSKTDKNVKTVDNAIAKLFKDYPPKKK